jgi:hypothetical protein
MKIRDYKVGTTFIINCTKHFGHYDSFGILPELAFMWARKENEIIKVECTIVEEDIIVSDLYKDPKYNPNSLDYFAHIDFNEDGTYSTVIIYHTLNIYNMCFPNGPDAERFYKFDGLHHKKDDRKSMTVRIKVEEI